MSDIITELRSIPSFDGNEVVIEENTVYVSKAVLETTKISEDTNLYQKAQKVFVKLQTQIPSEVQLNAIRMSQDNEDISFKFTYPETTVGIMPILESYLNAYLTDRTVQIQQARFEDNKHGRISVQNKETKDQLISNNPLLYDGSNNPLLYDGPQKNEEDDRYLVLMNPVFQPINNTLVKILTHFIKSGPLNNLDPLFLTFMYYQQHISDDPDRNIFDFELSTKNVPSTSNMIN
jgi:hypothetical protein